MKKIFLILAAAMAVTACSAPMINLTLGRQSSLYYIDYSKYAQEGFLILPYPYQGEFDALGELAMEVNPAVAVSGDGWHRSKSHNYMSPVNSFFRDTPYFRADTTLSSFTPRLAVPLEKNMPDDLVRMAVDEARSLGADAIVNFRIEYFDDGVGPDDREGYIVSGFLIRRR